MKVHFSVLTRLFRSNLPLPAIAAGIFGLIVAGCATTELSPERVAAINSIYLDNRLEHAVRYQKTGTTVFQNAAGDQIGAELVDGFLVELADALRERGYEIAATEEDSDTVLRIEEGSWSVPYNPVIRGITVHSQSRFGINPGAFVHLHVCFRVYEPLSETRLAYYCSVDRENTDVKSLPDSWDGFSSEEQEYFFDVLRTLWETVHRDALDSLNL